MPPSEKEIQDVFPASSTALLVLEARSAHKVADDEGRRAEYRDGGEEQGDVERRAAFMDGSTRLSILLPLRQQDQQSFANGPTTAVSLAVSLDPPPKRIFLGILDSECPLGCVSRALLVALRSAPHPVASRFGSLREYDLKGRQREWCKSDGAATLTLRI